MEAATATWILIKMMYAHIWGSDIGESGTPSPIPEQRSRRWRPTREQLRILESLHNRGIRRPAREQIHLIVCELRRHGAVAGINVFYWFQNRKARERQNARTMEPPAQKNEIWTESEIRVRVNAEARLVTSISETEEDNSRYSNWNEIYILPSVGQTEPPETLQLFPSLRDPDEHS